MAQFPKSPGRTQKPVTLPGAVSSSDIDEAALRTAEAIMQISPYLPATQRKARAQVLIVECIEGLIKKG